MDRMLAIRAFSQLGQIMSSIGKSEPWKGFTVGVTQEEYEALDQLVDKAHNYNGWFTSSSVRNSLLALGSQLNEQNLIQWTANYTYADNPKKVMVIMAGNIPLVGFHDFLAVILSGNKVLAKLSSDDNRLLPELAKLLFHFAPELSSRIQFAPGQVKEFDAVIATGSNNSTLYFESYFGKYPHIFRKNRTSLAVLDGSETAEELKGLGRDVFDYFGLGCRNVSHLLLPKGFEINRIFEGFYPYSEVINNNKYGNNYDYNKAVYLLNQIPLLDNNFVLLRESEDLFSPLAMVNYHFYESEQEVENYLNAHKDDIQVVVGKKYQSFGTAQCPLLTDYADGIDTMQWLGSIADR
jgi:hypothetical protein